MHFICMINSWPLMIYTADDQRRINCCTARAAASPAPAPDGTARGHRCPRQDWPGPELFVPTALSPFHCPASRGSWAAHPAGTTSITEISSSPTPSQPLPVSRNEGLSPVDTFSFLCD